MKYDLNDVTEFIYEFAKAKAGISRDWEDDVDAARYEGYFPVLAAIS